MNPNAILIMTSIAFVVGILSWAVPTYKYAKHTEVGIFAGALLAAGIVFISMFKWSDVALEVWGAKLQIKERDQRISVLQTNLLKAQTALAEVEDKAPDTAALASYIEAAMQKAGVTVDQNTVKGIATESLKPLQTYFDSTEWNMTVPPNPCLVKPELCQPESKQPSGPTSPTAPGKLSPNYVPMVLPNDN